VKALRDRFGFGWKIDAKVLLFAGPPGMGKTTLAHIAARQAGYRAVEINASDDRTGKQLQERVADAQGMQSMFGGKKVSLPLVHATRQSCCATSFCDFHTARADYS